MHTLCAAISVGCGLQVGAAFDEGGEGVEVGDEDDGVHELRHGPLVLRRRQPLDDLLGDLPGLEGGPRIRKLSFSPLQMSSLYRVGHLVVQLGWVDLDLGCSTILLGQ